jgi:hypothetical protein
VTVTGPTRPTRPTRAAVVACGAIAFDVRSIAQRRGWDIDVVPVPALLHNRPEQIPAAVAEALASHHVVAVAYADCGTYGALDEMLAGTGVPRLAGDNCYDVLSRDEVEHALAEEPGTYFLTDFLARTFEHTVVRQLGLDRWPKRRHTYFTHYARMVWLAQRPTPATRRCAEAASERLGLPLEIRPVGNTGLERELERLLAA